MNSSLFSFAASRVISRNIRGIIIPGGLKSFGPEFSKKKIRIVCKRRKNRESLLTFCVRSIWIICFECNESVNGQFWLNSLNLCPSWQYCVNFSTPLKLPSWVYFFSQSCVSAGSAVWILWHHFKLRLTNLFALI